MRFGIKTLDEYDLKGKTVLCRVDMNQPVDKETNTLKSINRIKACVPTIKEMVDKGAKVVLMAHQGSDIEYKNFYTTEPHAKVLTELLGQQVKFIDDVCGPAARKAIADLQEGEILLLDNVRFVSEEQTLFELKLNLSHEEQAQTLMVRKLAPLGDLYVCDAFAAAHRDQPSLCGFEQVMPSAMGRLFEEEYCAVSQVMETPERPCVFVLGGAKISDAFMMMETVLSRGIADKVLTGGLVANILLAAAGEEIGKGSMDFIVKSNYADWIEKAKPLYEQYKDKIVLPCDLAYVEGGERKEAGVGSIPAHAGLVDIGHRASDEYQKIILGAKTVCVNGPMGIFEEEITEYGTKMVWEALAKTEGYTLIGGGDSVTATEKYDLKDQMSYICTAGGALIRFLSGEELPVVKALRYAAKTFA
ncbi:phosphoglycerate kinase [Lawsonibacter sp. OA9]|uniref:phosphoglycerate kinase n=1 Tax=Oscillospiraceae TaxID=216572 RepID=UPI001F0707EB|nr:MULTISPECIES: phosphoglycerate kinase [Oscillospiraceae]MCH1978208.1 phosphoglycerate kinase [Lawsonibacter sp. OA9]MCH1982366.1 phosphoglycerate kinase [Ruminococcus sp. OA3]